MAMQEEKKRMIVTETWKPKKKLNSRMGRGGGLIKGSA